MNPNNFEDVDFENQVQEELESFVDSKPETNFQVVDEIKDFNE